MHMYLLEGCNTEIDYTILWCYCYCAKTI
jgi:hypothetical protein